jgi:hypothetical protein
MAYLDSDGNYYEGDRQHHFENGELVWDTEVPQRPGLNYKYSDGDWIVDTDKAVDALDVEYEPQFTELAKAYATALMAGDTTTVASVQTDYTALKTEYQTKLEGLKNV